MTKDMEGLGAFFGSVFVVARLAFRPLAYPASTVSVSGNEYY